MSAPGVSEMMKQLSLAAVMKVIPQTKITQALVATETVSKRNRLLPAPMVVYLVVMLAFYAEVSVRENLGLLLDHLQALFDRENLKRPADSAVSKARQRLGAKPFAWLFEAVALPLGTPKLPGCFWRDFRVVAADGTTQDVQDTAENRAHFGVHKNQHGTAGYPQMKAVVLVECGTRVPLACALGRNNSYEPALFDLIQPHLKSNMLMLGDRAYYDFCRWKSCSQRAGALLWRVKSNLGLKALEQFPDGSYLAHIRPSHALVKMGQCGKDESLVVRVIEYKPLFDDDTEGETVRLITSLLDSSQAPADELAALYAERWSQETGYNELKTYLRGSNRVLRSQLPALVEQEWYGFLLAYYVLRATILEAAQREGCAPRALSFARAVRVVKRQIAFFPSGALGDGEDP
jgi:hypothetical protein